MDRWLVRFGYDGTGFRGWARQPGLSTIEGTISAGVLRRGAAPLASDIRVASRTDRGVSARANALALSTSLRGAPLLRALNGIAPEIWFTAATQVPGDFRVRAARMRTYRYFEVGPAQALERMREGAARFRGTIDVRSFGRDVDRDRPVLREIEGVRVDPTPTGRVIEVRARSFVWGMVRKIVAALRAVDVGQLSLASLSAAVGGQVRLTLPLAEPEALVLWEVDYDLPWEIHWRGPNRGQREHLRAVRAALHARAGLFESIGEMEPPPNSRASARRE